MEDGERCRAVLELELTPGPSADGAGRREPRRACGERTAGAPAAENAAACAATSRAVKERAFIVSGRCGNSARAEEGLRGLRARK